MLRVVRNLIPCVCLFLVFAFLFLGANPASASETIDASVGINPSLTLTLPTAALNLSLDPSTTTFGYKDLPISVATNNETGYIMTVSTAGNNTDLVNTTDSNIVLETLPTLAGGYTDSTFVVNKWGYKNGLANNYFPFVSGATVLSNAGPTNGDSTTLRFGTKIDYMQPEGTYSTTFNFNLVVNPVIHYMQDFTQNMCTTTPQTLVDKRDNKEYTVARLADGQCWMTSNLNLTGGTPLYSETSDVPAGYSQSGGTPYFTLPDGNGYSGKFSNDTVADVYNTGNETTDQSDCTSSQSCNSYYSWLAAVAGNQTNVTGNGEDAPYSICPKGWRLPKSGKYDDTSATSTTGYKKGDFYKLATAYGVNLESSSSQSSAVFYNNAGPGTLPNFLLAGSYESNRFYSGESLGYYWSSSSIHSTASYIFLLGTSRMDSAYSNARRDGNSVRCILKDTRTLSDIAYMQGINSDIVANTASGATKTLKDARDNQEYTVEKINGNIWMTKNLAIGCDGSGSTYGGNMVAGGKTLTPQDSNVSSSWNTDSALSLDRADNTTNCTTSSTSDCDSYTTPRMKCSTTYGAWYNYAAASAMTITGASSSVQQVDDVCPVGWRLPSQTEMAGIVSYQTAFNPIAAGNYNGGSLIYPGYANWWTATRYNNTSYYILYYDSSSLSATIQIERYYGRNIRCIAK